MVIPPSEMGDITLSFKNRTLENAKMNTNQPTDDGDDFVVEACYEYVPKPAFTLCVEYWDGSRFHEDYLDDEWMYADGAAKLAALNPVARRVFLVAASDYASGYQESYL